MIKDGLATDVWQAQGVAITTHTGHHTGQNALGIRRISCTKTQLIHHGDWTRAHGHDVADNATHAGGRTLVGLHIGRVVVGLHLEGHRMAIADVNHAGILADASQHLGFHFLRGGLPEVAQVHLGGLVGAVLRPHDGIHGQLGIGGTTPQDLADPGVFIVL